MIPRGTACSGAAIFQVAQAFTNGQTGTQYRNALSGALAAVAPAAYTVSSVTVAGSPGIRISTSIPPGQDFDICVDGTRILGFGVLSSVSKSGLTLSAELKTKAPGLSSVGLIVLMALLAIGAFWILRRRDLSARPA